VITSPDDHAGRRGSPSPVNLTLTAFAA